MPYISLTKAEKDTSTDDEIKHQENKKVFRHPVRDRILGILRDGKARTQRDLGKILSMSNAAIHYHMKILLEIGIVKLDSTRPGPNGITEKLYKADIENWPDVSEDDIEFYLDYMVSWMNERHREGVNLLKSADYETPFLVGSYSVRAPLSKMIQFKREVENLFNNFYTEYENAEDNNLTPFAVTFSIFPSQEVNTEDSRNIMEFESGIREKDD
ncbi:MAG: helix-turn-helix transcriptional regulator [Desulfobacterales bacterium]|nr:helix-turn-helix transcriptional regulator [Desulfobacterales bacterium]